jgi:hypothetical protein
MHKAAHPNNRARSLRAKTIEPLPWRIHEENPIIVQPLMGTQNECEFSAHTRDFLSRAQPGSRDPRIAPGRVKSYDG